MPATETEQRIANELVMRLFDIINSDRLDGLTGLLAEDVVVEWPQSNERVRGLANFRSILGEYPGGALQPTQQTQVVQEGEAEFAQTPMFSVMHVEGTQDNATATVKASFPDGTDWYIVTLANTKDDRIVKLTQFFAPVYERPEWRAEWTEHLGPTYEQVGADEGARRRAP